MKQNIKRYINFLILVIIGLLSLVACNNHSGTKSTATAGGNVKLRVAASPTPHAEILEQCKAELAKQNIDLEVVIFDDYILPNTATEDGEVEANYFQHTPYLEDFNSSNNTHIVSVGKIHYEPFALYAGKLKNLEELESGNKKIAIPNDGTNEGRALKLLEDKGYIKLKKGTGFNVTLLDIAENPHNLDFAELDAAQITRSLPDVDFAIINGNYAIQAGLNASRDALLIEDGKDAVDTFANVLAVREGHEEDAAVLALLKILKSQEIKHYADEHFQGTVTLLTE